MPGLTEQPCRFLCVWADAGAGSFNSSAGFPWVSPPQGCLSLSLNFGTKWSEGYFSVNPFLFRTDDLSRFGSPVILQYLSALIWREGNPCHKPSDTSAVLSQAQMIQGQTRRMQFLPCRILRSVRSTSSPQLLCLSRMSSFLGDLSGLFTPFYTPPHHLTFPICKSTFFFN